jgi:hypothetical protein
VAVHRPAGHHPVGDPAGPPGGAHHPGAPIHPLPPARPPRGPGNGRRTAAGPRRSAGPRTAARGRRAPPAARCDPPRRSHRSGSSAISGTTYRSARSPRPTGGPVRSTPSLWYRDGKSPARPVIAPSRGASRIGPISPANSAAETTSIPGELSRSTSGGRTRSEAASPSGSRIARGRVRRPSSGSRKILM